jgi:hypothetical protein
MALNFNARIDDDKTRIEFRDETSSINIINSTDTTIVKGGDNSIYFLIKNNKLVYVGKTLNGHRNHADKDFDKYIIVSAPKGVDINYLEHSYIELAKNRGITLVNSVSPKKPQNMTQNKEENADDFMIDIEIILEKFGFDLFEGKAKKYNKNRLLSTNEKVKDYQNNKIITIGGRITKIYVDDVLYDGNMKEKLREIAKDAGVNYSKWAEYKQKGTVHFAMELMKQLPDFVK